MDAAQLRDAMIRLPRAPNHRPGEPVALEDVYTVQAHRAALDLERLLVVGNRGMGKSFWAHALLDERIRAYAAKTFRFPSLCHTQVVFGFNGSARADRIAPTPDVLEEAGQRHAAVDLWRAVLVRAVLPTTQQGLPDRFADLVTWVAADRERCARVLTQADDTLHREGQHLLVLFDALERVATDWPGTRERLRGLLQLALAAQSFRAVRLKLFLRADQFADQRLFEFPDASKVRNVKVDLTWPDGDLYEFLFQRLRASPAFLALEASIGGADRRRHLVNEMAGEFMGANEKRGRVFTWLPTHLSDAQGQISPRTFLTVWREAAAHTTSAAVTAVDHLGLHEGVRCASADRLRELEEDYPWVRAALEPLRGELVPMERVRLETCWRQANTVERVARTSMDTGRMVDLPLANDRGAPEEALLATLQAIGVLEVRANGKINVPDIFRVEAGIKRRGGVKPPSRTNR